MNRVEILAKYSKDTPAGGYTEEAKKEIVAALFPDLDEEGTTQKMRRLNRKVSKTIKQLCESTLNSPKVIESTGIIHEKEIRAHEAVETSLVKQKEQQQAAIEQDLVKKFTSLSYHTLVNKLSTYNRKEEYNFTTSDIEYKFQLSWSPLFETDDDIHHTLIHPTWKQQENNDELIIRHSVFDVRKMPLELLHLGLYGTPPSLNLQGEKEYDLLIDAAHRIEEVKSFLIAARPLEYTASEAGKKEYTERILKLSKNGKGVGYLLSENTPFTYDEKELKNYINNMIRYTVFANKSILLRHLIEELPYAIEKIPTRTIRLDLVTRFPSLKDTYINEEDKKVFMAALATIQDHLKEKGLTATEQKIRKTLESITYKNRSRDTLALRSIHKSLSEGIPKQEKKVEYLKNHINALQADPDF